MNIDTIEYFIEYLNNNKNELPEDLQKELSILLSKFNLRDLAEHKKTEQHIKDLNILLDNEHSQIKINDIISLLNKIGTKNNKDDKVNFSFLNHSKQEKMFVPFNDMENFNSTLYEDDFGIQWINKDDLIKAKNEAQQSSNPLIPSEKYIKLKKISDTVEYKKPIIKIENFNIFDDIVEKCPNFKDVIKYYKGNFILNHSKFEIDNNYIAPTPILLLGEPGIGKTYFAKMLAKSLNTSFNFLDANSITASWVLTGSSNQWHNADYGNIFKFIMNSKTISPLVIFDEIDKLSNGKSYDTLSVFHQLLEPENSKVFKDEYLNLSFDASKFIYILTANSASHLPDSLLSRMKVFDIKKPNDDELKIIIQNMYSEIIGSSPLFNPVLDSNILNNLIKLSPRDIKKELLTSICSQLAENDSLNQNLLISFNDNINKIGF